MCNRSNGVAVPRLAVASADTPNAEYIEFDTEILAKGVLERTGIVLDAGRNLLSYSSADAVSCVVMGIETAA